MTVKEWCAEVRANFSEDFDKHCQQLLEEIKTGNNLHYTVRRLEQAVVARRNKLREEERAEKERQEKWHRETEAACYKLLSVANMEVYLDEFIKRRNEHYNDNASAVWETAASLERLREQNREFSYLFKNFVRRKLNLPTL